MHNCDLAKHVAVEDGCAQLDHIGAIADLTDTTPSEWIEADGPDSRVGVSYWYVHRTRALTAYISEDQQYVAIQVSDDAGDELASVEIDLNEIDAE